MLRTSVVIIATFMCASCDSPEDKAARIVGNWQLTQSEKLPDGAVTVWVFNREGTATSTLTLRGGQAQVFAHRWQVSGDQLIITTKTGTGEETVTGTIVKLGDKFLQVKDTRGADELFTRL